MNTVFTYWFYGLAAVLLTFVSLIFLHRRNTQLVIVDIPRGTERGNPDDGRDVTAANPAAPLVQPFFPGKVFRIHKHLRAVPFPFSFHVCIGHGHDPLLALCVKFTVRIVVQFFQYWLSAFCAAVSLKGYPAACFCQLLPACFFLVLILSTCLSKMFYPQSHDRRLGNSINRAGECPFLLLVRRAHAAKLLISLCARVHKKSQYTTSQRA